MTPGLQRASTFIIQQFQRAKAAIRRHPLKAALLLPTLLLLYVLLLIPFTPGIGDLRKAKSETPTRLLALDGTVLAEYKRINREWVALDKIAPHVVNALIATEDRRFFQHHGIDLRRIAGAVLSTLGGDLQGGSTITQQLARNLYPEEIGRAATLTRKIKEAITALKIESVYSKNEILETYLNTVPFLYNAFGIEVAARTYFDTSAGQLDVLQSATLIGMLKGTSYYNPVQNPERSLQRRNLVLAQMAKDGTLDPTRLEALSKRPLKLNFERQTTSFGLAPHVAQHLRQWLIDWADQREYDLESDGLRVYLTLDADLQKVANQAVTRQLRQLQKLADARRKAGQPAAVLQAGFLALDPRNGAVRAWVGSRDFAQEQFDHVSQARRQPGSTFKPFVYGAAFIQGFKPSDTFIDQPVAIAIPGSPVWTPSDATPPSYRPTSLSDGLAYSKNTITAQLMQKVGPARVAQLAQAMGVSLPKVAILSAVEKINPDIPSTIDAAALCKMADRKQITGGLLDGPLAFDNAINLEAANSKGIDSPVAGDADILIAPDLESGNILAKQLIYLGGAQAAGILMGARVPIMLTSRAEKMAGRLLSCALAQAAALPLV